MDGKKMKVSASLIAVLAIVAVAALFVGIYYQITGFATSGTSDLNVTVGNTAPLVTEVTSIAASNPSENGIRYIALNFTASDSDGVANLDDNSANVYFNRSGETTRQNVSCVHLADNADGNSANYTCLVGMYYFDGAGSWAVHANITDVNSATGTNHTTAFTYNLLTAMVLAPNALTWPTLSLGSTNQQSDNDPVQINNTGNDAIADGDVRVTAIDLQGETTTTDYIYAANFTVDDNGISVCSLGNVTQNGTAVPISGATLPAGNHSANNGNTGQEELYFCIPALNPDISAQSYSTAYASPWTIEIFT